MLESNQAEGVQLKPLAMLPSLEEQVYNALLEAILSAALAPGMPVVESTVAKQLGVSKTPVRAALRRLEHELLLRPSSGNRYCVAELRTESIKHIYLVRSRLEGLVAFLATPQMMPKDVQRAESLLATANDALKRGEIQKCAHVGRQFHQLLMHKVDNEFLTDSLQRLSVHVERGRRLAAQSDLTSAHSVEQHQQVLAAIKIGDAKLAEERMKDHIVSFIDEIQRSEFGA
jgi:DNA-binding GntR family transcriptional regulator